MIAGINVANVKNAERVSTRRDVVGSQEAAIRGPAGLAPHEGPDRDTYARDANGKLQDSSRPLNVINLGGPAPHVQKEVLAIGRPTDSEPRQGALLAGV